MIVITCLDRINVQKQRLSAGQWVLWWKASVQWTVSFWVSISKILPWFDTAYWRSLGWAEWQAGQPLNLHSLCQSRLYSDQIPEEQILFSAGSHTEYKMWWGQGDPRQMYLRERAFFCFQRMWAKNRPAYLRLWFLCPPLCNLIC